MSRSSTWLGPAVSLLGVVGHAMSRGDVERPRAVWAQATTTPTMGGFVFPCVESLVGVRLARAARGESASCP